MEVHDGLPHVLPLQGAHGPATALGAIGAALMVEDPSWFS